MPAAYDDGVSEIRMSVTGDALPNPYAVALAINSSTTESNLKFSPQGMQFSQLMAIDLRQIAGASDSGTNI